MPTLQDLIQDRGFVIDEHLEAQAEIPVNAGIQFQGDLAIIPLAEVEGDISYSPPALRAVGPAGVEIIRGENGGHTHLLVADPAAAKWTADVSDSEGLAIGVLDAAAPVHILHAEHGGTGIAPGRYLLRRQREQADEQRLVAD
jgi:hypothetical protein